MSFTGLIKVTASTQARYVAENKAHPAVNVYDVALGGLGLTSGAFFVERLVVEENSASPI
jgi:ribulose 1,5-bisphosphate synthetase/thiazole synthase